MNEAPRAPRNNTRRVATNSSSLLRHWIGTWRGQTDQTVAHYQRVAQEKGYSQQTLTELVGIATGWWTLPLRALGAAPGARTARASAGATRGQRAAAGAPEPDDEGILGSIAGGVLGSLRATASVWGSVLDCVESHLRGGSVELALDFDAVAESVGPASFTLSEDPAGPPAASDLQFVSSSSSQLLGGAIPRAHVKARVEGRILRVSLVNLHDLQPRLAPGEYRGVVRLGGGQVVPVSALRR